jgi:ADP-ribose pyrophosphatase
MKQFTRIEPTTVQTVGLQYKRQVVIKNFRDDDGVVHEFTTMYSEGSRAGAVVALTSDNQVITTYQFRPGMERWLYELPGGGFKSGETDQEAAVRELREETGYKPGHIEYLGESCGDAYNNVTFHYFFATDCVPDDNGQELDQEEKDQGAAVQLISIDELIANAKTAGMTDPRAVLMAYEKLRELQKTPINEPAEEGKV